jgi:hypothetical protein
MAAKHPELEWKVMDIREMRERVDELGGPESFDATIDKGRPH